MKVFCLLTVLGAAVAHDTGLPHQHPHETLRAERNIGVAPHALHAAPVHHGVFGALVHHAAPVHHAALHAAPHHAAPHHLPVPVHHAPVHPVHAPAPYAPPHPAPYHEEPVKNYEFGYGVDDYDAYGNTNKHSRHEVRDGKTVKGQYTVALPDCRTQIVDYYVDEYKQYHADVKYEGEICPDKTVHPHPAPYKAPHPAPHPAPYHAPAPAPYHAPAPAPAPYHPAPAPYHAPAPAPAPYHPPAPA